MPYVSIIVTVYNLEKYLEQCLISIMSQSFKDFELIIVNNGSTDRSQLIIDSYVSAYPAQIKCIVQENLGVSGSRNTGLRNSIGKYIMSVDGDDCIGKDFVKDLVHVANENDADMVFTKGHTRVNSEGGLLKHVIYPEDRLLFRVRGPWGHLYKREIAINNNISYPMNCNYEDNYFNMAFEFLTDKLYESSTIDYLYRIHSESMVHTGFKGLYDSRFPYQAFTALFQKANLSANKLKYLNLEFNTIRFFTAVIFSTGRKADKAVIGRLCDYAASSLKMYFPSFDKNPNLNLFKYKQVPLHERFGIWLFAKLVKYNLLKPFALIYTRF